jgi:DNA polymerase-1
VYSHFHQAVTATGRLSSSDPNLQNIPVRSDRHVLIRQAFVARKGYLLLSADYSQIELRILAHLSQDTQLCQSFLAAQDVHKQTASQLFGVDQDQITSQQRSIAKAINFGLMYGKTAFGLSEELLISRQQASDLINAYFEKYAGVKSYLDQQIEQTLKSHVCFSLFGRRRKVKEAQSVNSLIRKNAERIAMNSPIQATAADLIKKAMIAVEGYLQENHLRSQMLIQVHDEILLECAQEEIEQVTASVKRLMESVVDLRVPLLVNVSHGSKWSEIE